MYSNTSQPPRPTRSATVDEKPWSDLALFRNRWQRQQRDPSRARFWVILAITHIVVVVGLCTWIFYPVQSAIQDDHLGDDARGVSPPDPNLPIELPNEKIEEMFSENASNPLIDAERLDAFSTESNDDPIGESSASEIVSSPSKAWMIYSEPTNQPQEPSIHGRATIDIEQQTIASEWPDHANKPSESRIDDDDTPETYSPESVPLRNDVELRPGCVTPMVNEEANVTLVIVDPPLSVSLTEGMPSGDDHDDAQQSPDRKSSTNAATNLPIVEAETRPELSTKPIEDLPVESSDPICEDPDCNEGIGRSNSTLVRWTEEDEANAVLEMQLELQVDYCLRQAIQLKTEFTEANLQRHLETVEEFVLEWTSVYMQFPEIAKTFEKVGETFFSALVVFYKKLVLANDELNQLDQSWAACLPENERKISARKQKIVRTYSWYLDLLETEMKYLFWSPKNLYMFELDNLQIRNANRRHVTNRANERELPKAEDDSTEFRLKSIGFPGRKLFRNPIWDTKRH